MKAKCLGPVDEVGATPGALPSQTERESSLPSPARPAGRLRGREQRAKRPGSRLCHAGRGADTGSGTVCRPRLPGTRVHTRPPAASPTPGGTARHSDADLPAPAWRVEQWKGGEGHLGARALERGVTRDPQSQLGTLGGLDATAWRRGSGLSLLGSPLPSLPSQTPKWHSLLPSIPGPCIRRRRFEG